MTDVQNSRFDRVTRYVWYDQNDQVDGQKPVKPKILIDDQTTKHFHHPVPASKQTRI